MDALRLDRALQAFETQTPLSLFNYLVKLKLTPESSTDKLIDAVYDHDDFQNMDFAYKDDPLLLPSSFFPDTSFPDISEVEAFTEQVECVPGFTQFVDVFMKDGVYMIYDGPELEKTSGMEQLPTTGFRVATQDEVDLMFVHDNCPYCLSICDSLPPRDPEFSELEPVTCSRCLFKLEMDVEPSCTSADCIYNIFTGSKGLSNAGKSSNTGAIKSCTSYICDSGYSGSISDVPSVVCDSTPITDSSTIREVSIPQLIFSSSAISTRPSVRAATIKHYVSLEYAISLVEPLEFSFLQESSIYDTAPVAHGLPPPSSTGDANEVDIPNVLCRIVLRKHIWHHRRKL